MKDSLHNGRCFGSRAALPNLTWGSYLSFLFCAASGAHQILAKMICHLVGFSSG